MIKDWCSVTGTKIRREEFSMMLAMDASYREAIQIEQANNAAIAGTERDGAWT